MRTARCNAPEPGAAAPSRRDTLRRSAGLLLAAGVLLAQVMLLAQAVILAQAGPDVAQKKDKSPQDPQPVTDTLIKVTTFSEIGATVRGASLKLLPAGKDGNPVKGKAQQGVTNNMGEYPFRVPKTEATYVLRAEAKGFATTDKVVTARGEDQLDVFLQLPARK